MFIDEKLLWNNLQYTMHAFHYVNHDIVILFYFSKCLIRLYILQGEANDESPDTYGCSISALVSDWRQRWNSATGDNTDLLFPFGQVQVLFSLIDKSTLFISTNT